MATLTDEEFITKKDIYIFINNNNQFSARYLLAIINSKFISFMQTNISASAKKDDFTQITLNDIRKIKIPELTKERKKDIENLVDQILNAKKSDPNADTTALETEIDQMVYQLYNLTPEEIEIIESSSG
ncbi:hypothetical protein H6F32_19985 [Anabaena sp. FACHB-1237]|uniref:TaqI-like C-terminal specificity domain-containing protein n=1 Tax=Anabaena sp. FACHB-1237 TaxID=2692769 RepID=UPI0016809EAA|nr:TaqI-like C-terminal specificity domain-containing protein [Anabaena sp. FACHB-1237]MBD2139770.1 hypothetical protein [Anabaena sp. FACHB-1237]